MVVDPTNESRELPREWKRLIKIADTMGHGTLEITIVAGKPTLIKRAVQGIKLDEPEKKNENGDEPFFV